MTRLVTVAHGTRDPAGNETARAVTEAAGRRLGVEAVASYVEIAEPLLADVMAGLEGPAVVVPLLLSSGYHVRVDLPAAVARSPWPVRLGGPLGPDPALAEVQVARLRAAGARAGLPLVMVATGSNDPDSVVDLEEAARLLAEVWGGEVRLATMGGLGRRPEELLRPDDAVSPYLLAPGFFADRVRETCGAAAVVADVLGDHEAVVDLVVRRAAG